MGTGGDHRNRVLDLERLRRVDVLNGDLILLRRHPFDVDRLVLVADQHVPGAPQEDVGGLAAGTRAGLDVVTDGRRVR